MIGRSEDNINVTLFSGINLRPDFDVSSDGRFVVVQAIIADKTPIITIVENWYEAFKDR